MPEFTIVVQHETGLHARPLALFVKKAKEHDAEIEVTNLTRGEGPVNGKSPLKLLTLAVSQGTEILIRASGPQANEALDKLRELIESNFGE